MKLSIKLNYIWYWTLKLSTRWNVVQQVFLLEFDVFFFTLTNSKFNSTMDTWISNIQKTLLNIIIIMRKNKWKVLRSSRIFYLRHFDQIVKTMDFGLLFSPILVASNVRCFGRISHTLVTLPSSNIKEFPLQFSVDKCENDEFQSSVLYACECYSDVTHLHLDEYAPSRIE